VCLLSDSVADPVCHFDADPGPTFYFDADAVPDPDPIFHYDSK
jgi:hypothetical protein